MARPLFCRPTGALSTRGANVAALLTTVQGLGHFATCEIAASGVSA